MIKAVFYLTIVMFASTNLNFQTRHTPKLKTYVLNYQYHDISLAEQKYGLKPSLTLFSSELKGKSSMLILDSLVSSFSWIPIDLDQSEFTSMAVLEFIPSESDTLRFYLDLDHSHIYSEIDSSYALLEAGESYNFVIGQFPKASMLALGLGIKK